MKMRLLRVSALHAGHSQRMGVYHEATQVLRNTTETRLRIPPGNISVIDYLYVILACQNGQTTR